MGNKLPTPRAVAVSIPFRASPEGVQVCLVRSRKHAGLWVLPKGGVEKDEQAADAAVREMWEEAGLRPAPTPVRPIGTPVDDHKPHKHARKDHFVPRSRYLGFAVPVGNGEAYEASSWPEDFERERLWTTVQRAQELVAWRPDIAALLQRASQAGLLEPSY